MKTYLLNVKALEDDALFSKLLPLCAEERIKRIHSLARREDKNRCLGAGLLLSYEMKSKAEIAYNEFGKPFFTDFPDVKFNISHSGDFVLASFSDRDIGVDIEKIRDIDLSLADRVFTKKESSFIKERGVEAFFEFWTLKESYVKALGKGISAGLGSFEVCPTKPSLISPHDGREYFFSSFDIPGYKAAVCAAEKAPEASYKLVSLQEF